FRNLSMGLLIDPSIDFLGGLVGLTLKVLGHQNLIIEHLVEAFQHWIALLNGNRIRYFKHIFGALQLSVQSTAQLNKMLQKLLLCQLFVFISTRKHWNYFKTKIQT